MTDKEYKKVYGYCEVDIFPRLTLDEARETFHSHIFKLLMPQHLKEELKEMYRARVHETRKALERDEEERAMAEQDARKAREAKDGKDAVLSFRLNSRPTARQQDPKVDLEEKVPVENFNPSEQMVAYSQAELARFQEVLLRAVDSEQRNRGKAIVKKLVSKGNLRRVDAPVAAMKAGNLNELQSMCPHFAEVIEFVKKHLVHAQLNRSSPRIPPILLLGQPGVGKTYFAKELARALESGMRHIAYDSEITNSALLGSDKKWGNTSQGALFDQIVMGDHGNPVFFLDEIDKAARYNGNNHALTSLHSLLEPVSACSVTDISLDFSFDASAVIWVCAANSTRSIPASLLSRMEPFLISLPDAEQSLSIAQSVAERVHQDVSPLTAIQRISRKIYVQIAHLSPREQYKAISTAVTNASFNDRSEVLLRDLPSYCLDDSDEQTIPKHYH